MQDAYATNMDAGYAGQLASSEAHKVNTKAALEPIPFGMAVVQADADGNKCRLPMRNSVVLTISTHDLEASNSTVGTVAVTTIDADTGARETTETDLTATVYATSHAATLAAIAVKIAAIDGVASATASGSDDTITVVADDDVDLELSGFTTTLGSNQGTWSYAHSTTDRFLGVSLHKHSAEMDSANNAEYALFSAVNVLRRGAVYVKAEATILAGDPVYFRHADGGTNKPIGGFRKDSDSGAATLISQAVFPDAVVALAVGAIEVNLP